MQALIDRVYTLVEFHTSPIAPYMQVALGIALTFFQAQLLGALMVFLAADFLTGIWKARVLKKVVSRKFGVALDRMVFYIIVYSVLHGLTLVVPLGIFATLPETFVMTGYVLKEALSVLENMKVIQFVKGEKTPLIDALIKRMGMDIDRIITEIATESAARLPGYEAGGQPTAAPVTENSTGVGSVPAQNSASPPSLSEAPSEAQNEIPDPTSRSEGV